jgi:hypothetical protein
LLTIQDRKGRRGGLMGALIRYIKAVAFRVRWIFISPQRKYAYLWSKTKKLIELDYPVQNVTENANG